MMGASSAWYAISAWLRSSRSSAARAATVAVLEDTEELLCRVDERVRLLGLEPYAVVDAPPGDCDGEHARHLRRPDVERRVADVGRGGRIRSEPLGREQERFRIRLVPLRLVPADDRLEEVAERDPIESQLDRRPPLRCDDAEVPAFLPQLHEHVLHPCARLEVVVERL